MAQHPTIGNMRNIEQRCGMSIAALIVLFNDNPPCALTDIISDYAKSTSPLVLRNFLLDGIGYYTYDNSPLDMAALKSLPRPNWLDMFKTYVGMMGHSAQEFWQLTMEEYLLAVEGFCLLHRIEPAVPPATTADLHSLMAAFPDLS